MRYAIYLSLQFSYFQFFDISTLRAYVPFYISELIISVAYIFFLIKVYKNKEIEIIEPESDSEANQGYDNVNVDNGNEAEAFTPS